jgi:tetratricopeptide (TPR) repeat protein
MSRRSLRRVATLCAVLATSVLAAACAMSPAERAGLRPALPVEAEPELQPAPGPQSSLYGLFLAGEAALENGSSRDAAYFLGQVSERAPEAAFLKERAFTAALIAGDVERAAIMAPGPDEGTPATRRLGQLTQAVDLMARGEAAEASAILAAAPTTGSTGSTVLLLRGWAAAMAGDWDAAVEPVVSDSRLTRLFGALSRAKLLERSRRYAEAEAAYRVLNPAGENGMFVLAHGAFLERRGRRAEAVAVYDRGLARTSDLLIEYARARARAGRGAPPLGSLARGAAEMMLAPAALQMSRREPEVALALLRLSLRLAPDYDEAWLLVGDSMAAAGDQTAARDAHNRVRPTSPEYGTAQSRIAWALQEGGDPEGALRLAREEVDRSRASAQSLSLYADLLRQNERYAESIEVMGRLIRRTPEGTDAWRLYFTRGVALERLGLWDQAEIDLQKALTLQPEEPDVLNYLGFGWADRGQRLEEALVLLVKAAELRPQSGEIRDSLGWVRFRLGDYEQAVTDIERAVALAPADPAINDHLGDAYWAVGRRLEAEYQWRRVLTLDPDMPLRQSVEAKLKTRSEGAGALASAGSVQ